MIVDVELDFIGEIVPGAFQVFNRQEMPSLHSFALAD